jgi:hypothetical protein
LDCGLTTAQDALEFDDQPPYSNAQKPNPAADRKHDGGENSYFKK